MKLFPENPCIGNVDELDMSAHTHHTNFSIVQGDSDSDFDTPDYDFETCYDMNDTDHDNINDMDDTEYTTMDTDDDLDFDSDYIDLGCT